MLRLLHTADVHLGARHADLGDAAAAQRERQFAAFQATVELALAEKVDLFLIAGDLFDSNTQPRRSVERVAAQLKLLALVLSTALAGLAGGLFAYYHISYYPAHPFSPHWTFDSLLITFIGGVGTVHGPVLGALFYVFLREYLAIRWVDFHLLIFGALFVAIVLLLPGGLVEAAARLRALTRRPGQAC